MEGNNRRWWILVVLCLSLIVIMVDNTIVNVALPTLQQKLHATQSQLQWIVDSYILVFAGLLLTTGALSDRYGRRHALAMGLVVFGIGSALSAFAPTARWLIADRAVMGLGGAMIMPSTLSILTNVFPPHERARAFGIWAGISAAGIGIGPVAGGWLLLHYWWVVRADVAFEEASLELSRKFAERIAAVRASGAWHSAAQPKKRKSPPFTLRPTGVCAVAFLWKNLISAGHAFTLRTWIFLASFAVCAITKVFAQNL